MSHLHSSFEYAVETVDDLQLWCDNAGSVNQVSSLKEALTRLSNEIRRGRDYLSSVSCPDVEKEFFLVCSTPAGAKANEAVVEAVSSAISFLMRVSEVDLGKSKKSIMQYLKLRTKQDTGPTNKGSTPLSDERINEVAITITGHTYRVHETVKDLRRQMEQASKQVTLTRTPSPSPDQFALTKQQLLVSFRSAPFTLSRRTVITSYPLKVLNTPQYISSASNSIINHPCFSDLERTGRAWATEEKTKLLRRDERTSTFEVLNDLSKVAFQHFEDYIDNSFLVLSPPSQGQQTDMVAKLPGLLASIQKVVDDGKRSERSSLRIAVCGPINAGKSTLINILIGRDIVPTSADGCTTWPLVIRHNPNASDGILTVHPGHVNPYLKALRGWGIKGKRDRVVDDEEAALILEQYHNELTKGEREMVDKFLRPEYFIPASSTGAKEIDRTLREIASLLRVCKKLPPDDLRPRPKNPTFPELELNYTRFGLELKDVEFVDLPGYGDKDISDNDLREMYRLVGETCHAVIIVCPALKAILAEVNPKMVGHFVREYMPNKPKMIVSTMAHFRDRNWSEDDQYGLVTVGFKTNDEASANRVYPCTPTLLIGARNLREAYEKGVDYQDAGLLPYTDACRTQLWGARKDSWASVGHGNIIQDLQSITDEAMMDPLPSHLRRLLANEARLQRYQTSLERLKLDLHALVMEQQSIFDASFMDESTLADAKAVVENYRQFADATIQRWISLQETFNGPSRAKLRSQLEEAEKRAMQKLVRTLHNRVAGVSFDQKTNIISFTSGIQATNVMGQVEMDMKVALDDIQAGIVDNVKASAKEAWADRINTLRDFVLDHYEDVASGLESSLQNTIVMELEELSGAHIGQVLRRSVEDKLINKAFAGSQLLDWHKSPYMPRQKAEEAAKEQYIKYRAELKRRAKAGGSASDSPSDEQPTQHHGSIFNSSNEEVLDFLTDTKEVQDGAHAIVEDLPSTARKLSAEDADKLYTDGVNYVGFLVREPVLGTMVQRRDPSKHWSLFKSNSDPCTVNAKDIIEKYDIHLMKPWKKILSDEAWRSLEGALALSSRLGVRTIRDVISAKKKTFEEQEAQCKLPLPRALEEDLILLQSNTMACHGATEEILGSIKSDFKLVS
ncbi:hypothetical protein PIIN_09259 [Serendipita indica DSM 11827]|uniref:Dynamin N-terminal domain-containing protein n=1 Tax=Serendipita indica (strain DSM 11827) TaxID=1109443 RepID=G4TVD2_SERID|nr:hypothetical protein PIIN_09259 [Serendipita indica DSM 11827]